MVFARQTNRVVVRCASVFNHLGDRGLYRKTA